jgi:diacylglycerol kinase family enzyme
MIINRKSGIWASFDAIRRARDRYWDVPGVELSYQFSQSADDGAQKVKVAVDRGIDTVLIVGGDGTVNSLSRELVGTGVELGVIPTGSGNGFARHFEMPLSPPRAIAALSRAKATRTDVGIANKRPFFVTCSMAWDAAIVRSFEKSAVRGVVPYVFAGLNELLRYRPQGMELEIDGKEVLELPDPIIFTVANLTQFGAGARIAPHARGDDGKLELVAALRQDVPKLVFHFRRLFDGTIKKTPHVAFRSFKKLVVRRKKAAAIQIDGELVDEPARVDIRVVPKALTVLVPIEEDRRKRGRRVRKGG